MRQPALAPSAHLFLRVALTLIGLARSPVAPSGTLKINVGTPYKEHGHGPQGAQQRGILSATKLPRTRLHFIRSGQILLHSENYWTELY